MDEPLTIAKVQLWGGYVGSTGLLADPPNYVDSFVVKFHNTDAETGLPAAATAYEQSSITPSGWRQC